MSFESIRDKMDKLFDDFESEEFIQLIGNEVLGNLKQRVFQLGLDAEQNPIGGYTSKSYKRRRRRKGLQVSLNLRPQ